MFDGLNIIIKVDKPYPMVSLSFNINSIGIKLDMGQHLPFYSFHAKYDAIDITLKKAEDSTLIYEII